MRNDYENDDDNVSLSENRLELSLQEDNELSFKLVIEGAVSNPDLATPNFRFTVMEAGGQKGWVYPVRRDSDDVVSVSIPAPINEGFKTGKLYEGKLEVIIGRLYFSPAEMMFEFKSPVEVSAAPLIEKQQSTNNKREKTSSVFSETPAPSSPSTPMQQQQMPSSVFAESDEKGLEEEIASVIAEEKKTSQKSNKEPPRPLNRPSTSSTQGNAQMRRAEDAVISQVFKDENRKGPAATQSSQAKKPNQQTVKATTATTKKTLSESEEKLLFKAKLLKMFKSALAD